LYHVKKLRNTSCLSHFFYMNDKDQITQLLQSAGKGDQNAYNRLFPLVYDHLRSLAQYQLSLSPGVKVLSRTELIHEMYLKLIDQTVIGLNDRAHFYSMAAKAMRHIMVDHFRKNHALKRGGDQIMVPVDENIAGSELTAEHVAGMHELMEQLREVDERMYQIVDLRFFGGLTIEEIADLMGVSTSTVDRNWKKARGWLYMQLMKQQKGV
jgi:RNA polymerase sigma-70 factor, ECF subfamily